MAYCMIQKKRKKNWSFLFFKSTATPRQRRELHTVNFPIILSMLCKRNKAFSAVSLILSGTKVPGLQQHNPAPRRSLPATSEHQITVTTFRSPILHRRNKKFSRCVCDVVATLTVVLIICKPVIRDKFAGT